MLNPTTGPGAISGHLRARGVASLDVVCAPLGDAAGLVKVLDVDDVPAAAAALLDLPGVADVDPGVWLVAFRLRDGP